MRLDGMCLAAMAVMAAMSADAKVVALAEVGRRSEKDLAVFEAAIKEAGHEVRTIRGAMGLLEKPETYKEIDAIVLTGGWNDYYQPTPAACRRLIGFAANGGGVFLGAFRGGPVRTCGFSAFPEIARTYNRGNTPWLWGSGDSPIAKAFGDKPMMFAGFDHMVLKVGERGNVFAKNGDDAVGAFGEFGLGRVVVLGSFVSVQQDDEDIERKKGVFRAIVEYLVAGDKTNVAAGAKAAADAEAAFDRRMLVWNWTCDGRDDGRKGGIVPRLRDDTVVPVESRAMLLEFLARELGKQAEGMGLSVECGTMAKMVREVSNAIRTFSDDRIAAVKASAMPLDGVALTNEFVALAEKCPDVEADALIEKARVALRAQRKKELAAEHAEDIKFLPTLVTRISSPDPDVRLDAATELGRIGEATHEVVAALVNALDDSDDKVRVQATISLGWMQSREAVPALIAKARQNDDLPLKRRAIQALGQIGDDRAISVVLAELDSIDRYTVDNAILALGWLKVKEAVPRLIDIAADESKPVTTASRGKLTTYVDTAVMNRRGSAVVALGYIGDNAAVPVLEHIVDKELSAKCDERPLDSCIGASLKLLAKEAISQIAAGGRAERGVRQPESLSSKSWFYASTRTCSVLAGRIDTTTRYVKSLNGHETLLLPYLLDAGFSGTHSAWDEDSKTHEGVMALIRDMDDYGLVGYWSAPVGGFHPMPYDLVKPAQENSFRLVGDCASYAGVWNEEGWPIPGYYSNYKLDEDKDPSVCNLTPAQCAARVAYLEEIGRGLDSRLREAQDWMRGRRKGFAMTYSLETSCPAGPIGGFAALGRMDNCGVESYETFGRANAYLCARIRNGAARTAMAEFYNWMAPSNEHVLRGCWQNAIHSKCHFAFALNQFSPFFGSYGPWMWDKGRWEIYSKVARHVRDNKELYSASPNPTGIAIAMSERSAASFRHLAVYRQVSFFENFDQDALAIWTALNQSHLNADIVFLEGATERKLAKYKVIFLGTARMLAEDDIALLRKWVVDGGTLVCEGGVSLFEPKNLARRTSYAIGDLLGVRYAGTEFKKSAEVFAQRNGLFMGRHLFHAEKDLDNFFRFNEHIWRNFKPSDCIAATMDGVEYDASLGIDKVDLAGAKAVQTFADGSPALTVNEFGKGRVYFFASHCPSLGLVNSEYEIDANGYDFWPGVRETYEKLAREGLARAGAAPAVDLLNAPKDVEITTYSQNGGDRLVVHLLDYDVKSKSVEDMSLRINGDRPIKAVYRPGWNGESTKLQSVGRTVALGTFSVYDMVVIELE